jgi:hypothetical protein
VIVDEQSRRALKERLEALIKSDPVAAVARMAELNMTSTSLVAEYLQTFQAKYEQALTAGTPEPDAQSRAQEELSKLLERLLNLTAFS